VTLFGTANKRIQRLRALLINDSGRLELWWQLPKLKIGAFNVQIKTTVALATFSNILNFC
jgi:hypothetical protein